MLKYTQFCQSERALGKIRAFKNCSSGIWLAGDFLNIFLRFGAFEAHFLIKLSYKKMCIALGVGHKIVHITSTPFPYFFISIIPYTAYF